MLHSENLYFLHEIITPTEESREVYGNVYQLALTRVENDDIYSDSNNLFALSEHIHSENDAGISVDSFQKYTGIYEGCFVSKNESGIWVNANRHPIAKSLILKSNNLRGKLKKYVVPPVRTRDDTIFDVCTYHVNIGHGNTSLIVFKQCGECHIWMIDCSCYDYILHKNFIKNLNECFLYIMDKYGLSKISIEKLLITHMHFDHVSAVERMIDEGKLEDGAEIWINTSCTSPSKANIRILDKIHKSYGGCRKSCYRIVEPIVMNGTDKIEVLYPEVSVTGTNMATDFRAPGGRFNNSSVVYDIHLEDKSMVFPGDIEKDGWDVISSCFPNMNKATYYCVSHHGSITGHIRSKCSHGLEINNVSMCCGFIRKAILMGRRNAYPGIYSQNVLDDFADKLCIVENAEHFVELDWYTGKCSFY